MSVKAPTAPKVGSTPSRGGNLRGRVQQAGKIASSAARAAATQGRAGFWDKANAGLNQAEQQGKNPGQQVAAGLRKGVKGAIQRGSAAAKNAANQARYGNQTAKDIPNQDLRSQVANATNTARRLNNLRNINTPQGAMNTLNGLRNRFNKNKIPEGKANDLRKKALEKGLRAAGKAGGAYGVAAAEIIIFTKNHWRVVVTLIATLFLFFFMMFDASSIDPTQPQQDNSTQPTTSDTCNPAQFSGDAYGKTSVCTITVTDAESAQDITITDTILPGTAFVSADHKGTYDKASNIVTWDAQKLNLPLNPVSITVTVTVRITTHQNNTAVYNAYAVNPVGLSNSSSNGGATIPGNLPPSLNDCSGIYAYYMSITPGHQNYGDPNCSLIKKDPNGVAIINKDAILAELKTLKPSEAMGWFLCVVPNESSYNANAYLGASTSGKGAYGLVQMNPTGAGNGQYDNGKVVWPLQLSNGINYNDKVIGHSFSYWPTNYDPCLRSYGVSVP